MNEFDLKRNGEGYHDPTAYNAIKNVGGGKNGSFKR